MIRLYGFVDGGLKALHLAPLGEAGGPAWDTVAWVDLLEPDPEEKAWVEKTWGIEVPPAPRCGSSRRAPAATRKPTASTS